MSYTPEQMVADAIPIVRAGGATPATFARIAELLQRLASQPGLVSAAHMASLHASSSTFSILAEGEDGSALMLARFPSESPTPVHNHNSWGVACVVRGRDRHLLWKRLDDATQPGRARLELVEERLLEPGDSVAFGPPPDDIHSQQGVGEAAYELVYFGSHPNGLPRLYFDVEGGTVESRSAS